jgi:hypothetical protein
MRRGKSHKPPEGLAAGPGGQPAVNKTEAIRALLEEWNREGREAPPKALTEELQRRYPAQAWSLPYVSSIKSKLKKRLRQAAPPSPPGQAGPPPAQDPADLVLALKKLAKQAGGLDRLRRLIEALQSDG